MALEDTDEEPSSQLVRCRWHSWLPTLHGKGAQDENIQRLKEWTMVHWLVRDLKGRRLEGGRQDLGGRGMWMDLWEGTQSKKIFVLYVNASV